MELIVSGEFFLIALLLAAFAEVFSSKAPEPCAQATDLRRRQRGQKAAPAAVAQADPPRAEAPVLKKAA